MPSRNSVNRPKDNLNRIRKAQSLAKKRVRRGTTPRSTERTTVVLPSTSIALYTGDASDSSIGITSKSISKKTAKKIERNRKYAILRNGGKNAKKLLIDIQAKKESSMDIDGEASNASSNANTKRSKSDLVREALWSVIEDVATNNYNVDVTGEGTTLGGPFF
ncbi:unnamed protein product [[Candida] boidinii]|uniref:Unnamed protein product n=1 Tax=Candida boidinii TaxID=5477 RepID=A0A9W6T1L5_CANBO|nr:hypothetical protein B5S30_g2675 [[Candida] boidinii]GME71367.1 unnamed protein product [[Candida] boidinii]GMG09687.1 unnamed protein product [[Candida] boidinii]